MFGLKKSLLKIGKHNSVDPASSPSNPFGSDDESDNIPTMKPSKRISSEPNLLSTNPFDDEVARGNPLSKQPLPVSDARPRRSYKNDFGDSGGLENQSVQELENYGVCKAEETTNAVHGCLKIAEEIRADGTKTLIMLHHQGEQITRAHETAVDIDRDLSRGEKLLGSLGGMFSKTWKPKKTRDITGPVITRDNSSPWGNHLEQREKLGLNSAPKPRATRQTPLTEPTDALHKIEAEKAKQEDGLSDLSDLLGELKGMAVDMGAEIEKQNKGLDGLQDDVDELNFRVKQANQRGRRLLGK